MKPQQRIQVNPTTFHFRNERKWKDLIKDSEIRHNVHRRLRDIILRKLGNCSIEQFHSRSRIQQFVIARHLYCYFAYVNGLYPLKEIATYIGYDNHATVIHGRDAVRDLLTYNKRIQRIVQELEEEFLRKELWD